MKRQVQFSLLRDEWFDFRDCLGISIHPISKPSQHLISMYSAVLQEGRWKAVCKRIVMLLIYSQTGAWLVLGFILIIKKNPLHLILVWKQLDLFVWMKFWWSRLNPGNVVIRCNPSCLIPVVPRCDSLSSSYRIRDSNTLVYSMQSECTGALQVFNLFKTDWHSVWNVIVCVGHIQPRRQSFYFLPLCPANSLIVSFSKYQIWTQTKQKTIFCKFLYAIKFRSRT